MFRGKPESELSRMRNLGKKPETVSPPTPDFTGDFKKILVTTDFSAASRASFKTALDIAKLFEARLHVLHVFEYAAEVPSPDGGQLVDIQALMQDARDGLKELQQIAAGIGLQCETAIRSGIASDTIHDYIAAEQIDLTIMGTSALHGFERLIFGSTAEAVLRRSPTPVVTVGPRADAGSVPLQERPVVFATDFHPTTVHAVRLAAAIAQATHSPMHCLHVLPRSVEGGTCAEVIPAILNEALQHVAATSGIQVQQPICATTYGSEVSNAVVDYAKQHNAKLIVLGVRQTSLASTHTPAHIAYRIITEAACPVLTMAFEQHSHYFSSLAAACI
jgi:nucleotide-binding universal stress UspA family protein